jgi:hypothetical protein
MTMVVALLLLKIMSFLALQRVSRPAVKNHVQKHLYRVSGPHGRLFVSGSELGHVIGCDGIIVSPKMTVKVMFA